MNLEGLDNLMVLPLYNDLPIQVLGSPCTEKIDGNHRLLRRDVPRPINLLHFPYYLLSRYSSLL